MGSEMCIRDSLFIADLKKILTSCLCANSYQRRDVNEICVGTLGQKVLQESQDDVRNPPRSERLHFQDPEILIHSSKGDHVDPAGDSGRSEVTGSRESWQIDGSSWQIGPAKGQYSDAQDIHRCETSGGKVGAIKGHAVGQYSHPDRRLRQFTSRPSHSKCQHVANTQTPRTDPAGIYVACCMEPFPLAVCCRADSEPPASGNINC